VDQFVRQTGRVRGAHIREVHFGLINQVTGSNKGETTVPMADFDVAVEERLKATGPHYFDDEAVFIGA